MSIKALQEYTRFAKYARKNNERGRRETWEEQVVRVFDMHKEKFSIDILKNITEELDFAQKMVMQKRVLGSQRALQFGGKPILDKHARLYNCTVSYCDRPRFFQECMYLLLCGCGAGFSAQKQHVEKLPTIASPRKNSLGKKVFQIPDSIEGWSDSIGVLMSSYFEGNNVPFPEYQGYEVEFDFSLIRPLGAPISSGSRAPGPEPLKAALIKIEYLLDKRAKLASKLRPIDAYDIIMHSSDAVLAGGVRRSATICVFSHDDEEMVKAKTGSWFIDNPQRGRSNNSALLVRDEITKEEFSKLMHSVKQFGEPGFIWSESKEALFNPCVTGDGWIHTSNGPRQVSDLIGKKFTAFVNGKQFDSTDKGFFQTGTNRQIWKIKSKEGLEVRATDNHKFLVQVDSKEEWKELKDIKVDDQIVLHRHSGTKWNGDGTEMEGWLLGSLLGDGTFDGESACLDYWGETTYDMNDLAVEYIKDSGLETYHNITGGNGTATIGNVQKRRIYSVGVARLGKEYGINNSKEIGDAVEMASSDFYQGFLRGYFDSDGKVCKKHDKGASVRLWSVSQNNLQRVQRMLLRMGIYSKIYMDRSKEGDRSLPDGKGGYKDYPCQSGHELVISNSSIVEFSRRIGFSDKLKAVALQELISSYKRRVSDSKFVATVLSVSEDGYETVYDATVPGPHAFDVNGMYAHNCVEIGFWPQLKLDDPFVAKKISENKILANIIEKEKVMQNSEISLSGWQFCNLTEINMKKAKTEEEFLDACRAAAIIGTLQASYDHFEYLGPISDLIVKREALLGVSMTGMADNPEIAFDPIMQKKGAKLILKVNEEVSQKLGIEICARATCVKPAGCQVPETNVITSNGLFQLDEIGCVEMDGWVGHNISVATDNGYKNSDQFFVNGYGPTKIIQTDSGLTLESTLNHKYRVLKNGEYIWKAAEEIEEEDLLVYSLNNYPDIVKYQPLVAPVMEWSKYAHRKNTIKIPEVLNEDLAFFLGMYYGDGSNHTRSIRIHGSSLRKGFYRIKTTMWELFGIDVKEVEDKREGDRISLNINSKEFVEFLKVNNIFKEKSSDITLPLLIRSSPKTVVQSFIDGFNCADGNCDNNSGKTYCTTSYGFAEKLVLLLRSLGVEAKIYFMPPTADSKGNRMRYVIQEVKGRNGNINKIRTYHRDGYAALDAIGMYDFSVDKVVYMQDSSNLTCDLSVPDNHTYISNSYVSHNTTSCILGTASGIHPHHARRYFRRVQANKLEAPLQYFQKFNPNAIEESVWSNNKTDMVITFLCEVPDGAKTKNQVDAITLLESVKLTQQNWVEYGTRKEVSTQEWLRHNVSNTINIKPEEWEDVENHIYKNRKWYAGISMLPMSGDKDYPQAPFTAVYTPNEIVRTYGEGVLFASGLIVDGVRAFGENLWEACDCALNVGEIVDTTRLREKIKVDCETNGVRWKEEGLSPESPERLLQAWLEHNVKNYTEKVDWIRRAQQFAERYFQSLRDMTYCLKDVHNWKIWCDLQREYVDVDWSGCYEDASGNLVANAGLAQSTTGYYDSDFGKAGEACSGGACELGDIGMKIVDKVRQKTV